VARMKKVVFLLTVGVILTSISQSWSQEQTNVANSIPGPGPISLKISLDHDEISSGGELVLTVSMTNISDERHCYKMMRGGAMLSFDVEVLKANGEKVGPSPTIESYSPRTSSGKIQCLQGGTSLSKTVRLDESFDLAAPGTYSVRVSRYLQGRSGDRAVSNSLEFKVLP
jgi:hypothetical protein